MNISLRYSMSPKLLRAGILAATSRRTFAVYGCLGLAGTLVGVWLLVSSHFYTGLWATLIGVLFAISVPLQAWRMAARSPYKGTEFELTLTDDMLVLRRTVVNSEWRWEAFRQVTETSDSWILLTPERAAVLIPKAALTEAQRAELTGFLAARGLAAAGRVTSPH